MSSSFSTPHNDCGLCKIKDICSYIKCSVLFIFAINSVEAYLLLSIGLPVANAPDVLQPCGLLYCP
jgi:hypothetical protein